MSFTLIHTAYFDPSCRPDSTGTQGRHWWVLYAGRHFCTRLSLVLHADKSWYTRVSASCANTVSHRNAKNCLNVIVWRSNKKMICGQTTFEHLQSKFGAICSASITTQFSTWYCHRILLLFLHKITDERCTYKISLTLYRSGSCFFLGFFGCAWDWGGWGIISEYVK